MSLAPPFMPRELALLLVSEGTPPEKGALTWRHVTPNLHIQIRYGAQLQPSRVPKGHNMWSRVEVMHLHARRKANC